MLEFKDVYQKMDQKFIDIQQGGVGQVGETDSFWIFNGKELDEDGFNDPIIVDKNTGEWHWFNGIIPADIIALRDSTLVDITAAGVGA